MSRALNVVLVLALAAACAAGSPDVVRSRKLLGLFDGLKAISGVNKVVESHVNNGLKAGQKIGKTVQQQVKEVINADAKVGKAIAKATDKAINAGEKTLVRGIGDKMSNFAGLISGPSKGHHGSSGGAAKEAIKTIKAVEHGKQKVTKAVEKAVEEKQHAIKKATKQISSTIDHTHSANSKAQREAAKAISKALHGHRL